MGRRIDVEPDDVAQLVDEMRVVGELELPHPVRLQPVRPPDALDRADAEVVSRIFRTFDQATASVCMSCG